MESLTIRLTTEDLEILQKEGELHQRDERFTTVVVTDSKTDPVQQYEHWQYRQTMQLQDVVQRLNALQTDLHEKGVMTDAWEVRYKRLVKRLREQGVTIDEEDEVRVL